MDMGEDPQAARGVLAVDVEHLKISGHQAVIGAVAVRIAFPSAITEPPRVDNLAAIGHTAPGEGDRFTLRVLLHAFHWQPDEP